MTAFYRVGEFKCLVCFRSKDLLLAKFVSRVIFTSQHYDKNYKSKLNLKMISFPFM